ncbi:ribonucleoprotein PTB-binding 1-like [Hetaerina americana]|uniref:ribonucleoprotein PTB-binding 1-like n=1 Tax=Hetaerina americana TaxID=62018 RepID=UPI003A7F5A1E
MSIVSAEGLTTSSTNINSFSDDLLKSKHEKFWSGEVLATASTGEFWEDDPNEKLKRKVNQLVGIFHQDRGLQVKNLPRDVTEEEIRELLSDFPVQSVQIVAGVSGSVAARVTLEDPEMLEEWDRERVFLLRNQRMPVAPERTEMVMCVARLPISYTDEKFRALLLTYGDVSMCFLMISEKSGASKGYGFVKYTSKDAALKAKEKLNGMQINTCVLSCDWLDVNHTTFASLHSKCLYVDQLPPDFYDMGEFRKVFSTLVNPPYCQIALKNGCPQDWGLVEFNSADDAENTQVALANFKLKGHPLRISYYIPGVRALNLYLTLLNESDNKEKSALLPDPPGPAVFLQFQSLAMRNPIFAQNLQNIILQSTQKRNSMVDAPKKGNGSHTRPEASYADASRQLSSGNDSLEHQLGVSMNDPFQLGLGSNQPLLGRNPQMLAIMQSLLNKQLPSPHGLPLPLLQDNIVRSPLLGNSWIGNILPPDIEAFQVPSHGLSHLNSEVFNPLGAQKSMSAKVLAKPEQGLKTPLLNFPRGSSEDLTLKGNFKSQNEVSSQDDIGMSLQRPQIVNNSMTLINGILSELQCQGQFNIQGLGAQKHPEKSNIFSRDLGLMGTPANLKPVQFTGKSGTYSSDVKLPVSSSTASALLETPRIYNSTYSSLSTPTPLGKCESRPARSGGSLLPTPILPHEISANPLVSPNVSFMGPPSKNPTPGIHSPLPDSVFQTPPRRVQSLDSVINDCWLPGTNPSIPVLPLHHDALDINPVTPTPRVRHFGAGSSRWPTVNPGLGNSVNMHPNSMSSPNNNHARTPILSGPNPGFWSPPNLANLKELSGGSDVPWANPYGPSLLGSPPPYAVTPIGQKRKYDRILPSPEPSPEGNYIGQHSQGIGGHYADSYFKRKRN